MKPSSASTLFSAALFTLLAASCSTARHEREQAPEPPAAPAPGASRTEGAQPEQTVRVSYYGKGDGFKGKKTANGERFDPRDMTAAHRSLPFGTKVQLRNPETGKTVTVRVNDRGPFKKGRTFDVSAAAARALGIEKKGVSHVEMEILDTPAERKNEPADTAPPAR
jgi:rare lipoprotein A